MHAPPPEMDVRSRDKSFSLLGSVSYGFEGRRGPGILPFIFRCRPAPLNRCFLPLHITSDMMLRSCDCPASCQTGEKPKALFDSWWKVGTLNKVSECQPGAHFKALLRSGDCRMIKRRYTAHDRRRASTQAQLRSPWRAYAASRNALPSLNAADDRYAAVPGKRLARTEGCAGEEWWGTVGGGTGRAVGVTGWEVFEMLAGLARRLAQVCPPYAEAELGAGSCSKRTCRHGSGLTNESVLASELSALARSTGRR
ncbi:hypothetical protein AAFF_G00019550 [Aldrovandia affinis]|uniref:Uncharacterized protein n=1 Tax=Aldrovandia affinis TaxID=143900 RepID=A0AAD7S5X0_9TELE|nr:hypothetical protein AAFF_G00019550 [Aldrovandia affinis]